MNSASHKENCQYNENLKQITVLVQKTCALLRKFQEKLYADLSTQNMSTVQLVIEDRMLITEQLLEIMSMQADIANIENNKNIMHIPDNIDSRNLHVNDLVKNIKDFEEESQQTKINKIIAINKAMIDLLLIAVNSLKVEIRSIHNSRNNEDSNNPYRLIMEINDFINKLSKEQYLMQHPQY